MALSNYRGIIIGLCVLRDQTMVFRRLEFPVKRRTVLRFPKNWRKIAHSIHIRVEY